MLTWQALEARQTVHYILCTALRETVSRFRVAMRGWEREEKCMARKLDREASLGIALLTFKRHIWLLHTIMIPLPN